MNLPKLVQSQFGRTPLFLAIGLMTVAVVATGTVISFADAITPLASVTPILDEGNPTCQQYGLLEAIKLEEDEGQVADGTYQFTVDSTTYEVTLSNVTSKPDEPDEPVSFDWSSDLGMDAVIVKGSNEANVYFYDEALGDTELESPTEEDGVQRAISHITFCYDEPLGSITIVKEADPADDTNFDFTGNFGDFTLADPSNPSITFSDLSAGPYTVFESILLMSSWDLESISCETDDPDDTTSYVSGIGVVIDLDPGEDVTCTFTNVKQRGTITIVKEADPADDTNFDFTGDLGDFTLEDPSNPSYTRIELPVGSYQVTEEVPASWALEEVTCSTDDPNNTTTPVSNGVNIDLDAAEEITCTFSNVKQFGSITIVKEADLADDTEFEFDGDLGSFTLQDPSNPSRTFENLPVGSYQVAEEVPDGWDLRYISCQGNDPVLPTPIIGGVEIELDSDEDITCTFKNFRLVGNITILKSATPADDTEFNFTGDLGDFTLQDPSDPIHIFEDVPTGMYQITELVPNGWRLDRIECSTGDPSAVTSILPSNLSNGVNIDLDPDEGITCIFYNEEQPGQSGTTLSAEKTAEGFWNTRVEYDWEIEKTVTPDSLELESGESTTVEYTLDVDRELGSLAGSVVHGVSGDICITNGGEQTTENLKLVDQVEYKIGAGQFQPWPGASQTIIPDVQLAPGQTTCYPYEITFEPVEGAQYRNSVKVTITNHSGHLGEEYGPEPKADFSLPAEPTTQDEVDVEADVSDAPVCPAGFTCTPSDAGPWHLTDSDEIVFTVEVTNNSAGPGTYYLDNTATVTEEDSGETDEDDARVTITVPEDGDGGTVLQVEKWAEGAFARKYDWTISKSVEPEELELAQGESDGVTYTIEVERQVAEESYKVTGQIIAENSPGNAAQLVEVKDCIEYLDPDDLGIDSTLGSEPDGFTTLLCETLQVGGSIPPGETAVWDYDISFTPVDGVTAYRNRAEVTISNYGGNGALPVEVAQGDPAAEVTLSEVGGSLFTYVYRYDFVLPSEPTSEEDACALVTDAQAIPAGFSATDDYPGGGWQTCESSDTFTIHKTVTNDSAGSGIHYLDNVATVTEEDTSETDEDDARVTITVPQERSTITIIKKANIQHDFDFTGDLDDFTLTSKSDEDRKDFSVAPGVYTVEEDKSSFPDQYWALFKVSCNGNSVPVDKDLYNARATITLEAGEHITCTFENQRVNVEEE